MPLKCSKISFNKKIKKYFIHTELILAQTYPVQTEQGHISGGLTAISINKGGRSSAATHSFLQ